LRSDIAEAIRSQLLAIVNAELDPQHGDGKEDAAPLLLPFRMGGVDAHDGPRGRAANGPPPLGVEVAAASSRASDVDGRLLRRNEMAADRYDVVAERVRRVHSGEVTTLV
jgi:hypothetical protein